MPHLFGSGNDEGLKRSVLDGMLDLVVGKAAAVGAAPAADATFRRSMQEADHCPTDCASKAAAAAAVANGADAAAIAACEAAVSTSTRCWGCRRWFSVVDEEQLLELAGEINRAVAPGASARHFELVYPPPSARSWVALRLAPLRSALLEKVSSRLETCLLGAVLRRSADHPEEASLPGGALARILQLV